MRALLQWRWLIRATSPAWKIRLFPLSSISADGVSSRILPLISRPWASVTRTVSPGLSRVSSWSTLLTGSSAAANGRPW